MSLLLFRDLIVDVVLKKDLIVVDGVFPAQENSHLVPAPNLVHNGVGVLALNAESSVIKSPNAPLHDIHKKEWPGGVKPKDYLNAYQTDMNKKREAETAKKTGARPGSAILSPGAASDSENLPIRRH